jgi:hypothetical protein
MITLFRALIIPILEYCCQLWTPFTLGAIRQLERVQRTFTSRIREMEEFTYWEKLQRLGLNSLQRRRERGNVCHSVHRENDNWNGTKLLKRDLQD